MFYYVIHSLRYFARSTGQLDCRSEFLNEIVVELVTLKMHHAAIVVNLVVAIDVEHDCEALHS